MDNPIEEILQKQSYQYVCGVDEAGRGPLAGPVFTACVVIPVETRHASSLPQPDIILIDALSINIPEIPQINLIKGDSRSLAIAMASILAKVDRDRYMTQMAQKYRS